ncbi:beta-galactosidase [Actinophytocola xanthii]|uniref:Beta-galactosidase n=1 Tax=Actinophytocola xanthii TaxID=1912961 RepID=A0A1Q8CPS5_9PSEU|nr:beta-galactosidase [Actinophytocola xanthii]OLF16360.1 beta-galactosidase [Actinophytocola xanthii]
MLPRLDRIAFGGDYNPEQWPPEVWVEDVALMREAGVNLVTVGVFAWAELEPAPGELRFGWLDHVLDLLAEGGIAVDLATPTAAPPPWFSRRHPDSRLVGEAGEVFAIGSRQSFCPSSPAYRTAAARITEELARRYAGHPAIVLWHAHNEYGGANPYCHCPVSAAAFRDWLRERYGDLDALNAAWGTTFWSQRYGDWAEIGVPGPTPAGENPAQRLDFMRFSADEHLANFRAERDILRRLSPGVPVTTNFMVPTCKTIDYWRWASEVDVVANDHYLRAERTDNHVELAMAADLTRSVAGGAPWMLLEHSTSAVNWQQRNLAKGPGELRRNSLTHLARGADAVMFFQWRASRFGMEKFHSAMLPQGGTDTGVWRDVVALGAALGALSEVRGSRVAADVGMVWDWESWWAVELAGRPSADLDYRERVEAYYDRLWRANLTVDFVRPGGAETTLPLLVVPSLYLVTAEAAASLSRYVEDGGTLVVSYFSGIVDANDRVHPGPYPGALREVLGLTVEEFRPLHAGESVTLDNGAVADVWTELLHPRGAETVYSYVDGPAAGSPAVTRHAFGAGVAWYVSTRLRGEHLDPILTGACADAGISPRQDVPPGLELVRRGDHLIAVNHTGTDVELAATGTELLTDTPCSGRLVVPALDVRVLRTESAG